MHGIENSPGGGEIGVESRIEEGHLRLTVSNSGVIDSNSRNACLGLGLKSIREQLESTYGNAASFEIGSHPDKAGKKPRVLAEIRIRLVEGGCTDS